jgi:hypothetical protein
MGKALRRGDGDTSFVLYSLFWPSIYVYIDACMMEGRGGRVSLVGNMKSKLF